MHSARNLQVKELIGKMDPFAVVTISNLKDEKFKTSQWHAWSATAVPPHRSSHACTLIVRELCVLFCCRCLAEVAQDQHQTPVWEQSYLFNLEGKEELFHLNVWNEATLGDDRTHASTQINGHAR